MEQKQQQFSLWYFLVAFMLILAMQNFLFAPHPENLAYNEFKALLKAGNLEDVAIGERMIVGTLKIEGIEGLLPRERLDELKRFGEAKHRFVTVRVDDSALVAELEAAGVRFVGVVESRWFATLLSWILPAVIFFALWGVLMKRMGGAARAVPPGHGRPRRARADAEPAAVGDGRLRYQRGPGAARRDQQISNCGTTGTPSTLLEHFIHYIR